MSDHSHASHRQPEDPAARGQVPHKLGEFYPLDDIVAVVDDQATGERARQALVEAGIPADDIDLIDGAWFIERGRQIKGSRTFAEKLGSLLASEERSYVEEYEEEAQNGHSLMAVHAESEEIAEQARKVLASHGARRMRHYRPHIIQELAGT
jgi:hypothetical protein